ncbi:MAG: hypothetical protein J0M04_16495 [Verrucomicrobia bacterium]|nr:hypothetical protein [Verrucomicrobiota bacterium]
MPLESDILSDFKQLLSEHGTAAIWGGLNLSVLVSRVRGEQQIDMGGFVESPDLSVRVAKTVFTEALPKMGERFVVDGTAYRIGKVSGHPRSPLLTLTLSTADE